MRPPRQPHPPTTRPNLRKWFVLLSILVLTSGTSAFAQTRQKEGVTLAGSSVTTGNTVAASTFTQGSEGTTAQSEARFLNLAPDVVPTPDRQAETDPSFGSETEMLGFGAMSGFDHLYSSTVTADNVTLSGGPAPVPEPGILVTVISLGFTTGVALLRGQNRVSSNLSSHRLA